MTSYTQKAGKGIAVVTVAGAASWSPKTKQKVIAFLRRQANFLKGNSHRLAKRYRARYVERPI